MEKKILVVDDSVTIRQSIKNILENQGFLVKEAIDGEEALMIIQNEYFDLIFTDVNMPKLDGISFIQKARETTTTRHTPIITLTTENNVEIISKGKKAGATGWMLKPFTVDKIIEVTKKLLS